MGAAARGPGHCTCWAPVLDRDVLEPQHGPPSVRKRMCGDCAFRGGSPERSGDRRYAHSGEGDIDALVASPRALFFCHQGMARKVALRHGPTGAIHWINVDSYSANAPDGRACKADGSPADICAGFWAAKERHHADM